MIRTYPKMWKLQMSHWEQKWCKSIFGKIDFYVQMCSVALTCFCSVLKWCKSNFNICLIDSSIRQGLLTQCLFSCVHWWCQSQTVVVLVCCVTVYLKNAMTQTMTKTLYLVVTHFHWK